MNLTKGDIVLVPFPFTDLSQTKLRPGVVLWVDSQGQDITVCFISSQNLDCISIEPSDPEFTRTGLKLASKIRVARVVTLERRLIKRRLGSLGQQQIQHLNAALSRAFQIN